VTGGGMRDSDKLSSALKL